MAYYYFIILTMTVINDQLLIVLLLFCSVRLGGGSRARRAPQAGCNLGTCQMHNLANTLYQLSKNSDREQSKNTHDPQGFGR